MQHFSSQMTPSVQSLAQRVPDFATLQLDSVDSRPANDPPMEHRRHVAPLKNYSEVTKNGFFQDVGVSLEATLTEGVFKKRGASHIQTAQITMQNERAFPGGRSVVVSSSIMADRNDQSLSAEDVSVDVVSATSRDLSTLHRSLWLNAEGNHDLDEHTPVEPFVQELVQWKKVRSRARPKKSPSEGLLLSDLSKRKRSLSDAPRKKRKSSPVDHSKTNIRTTVALQNVLSHLEPCVITMSSKSDPSSEMSLGHSSSVATSSLASVCNYPRNVATTRSSDVVESLSITSRTTHNLSRAVNATITSTSESSNSVSCCHSLTSLKSSPSIAAQDVVCLEAKSDRTISCSSISMPPMMNANEAGNTCQDGGAALSPTVPFIDSVEVVDLEEEGSDLDEGEELLLADIGADLASAVQFVEVRPDDLIGDQAETVATDELRKGQSIAGDLGVSDAVIRCVDGEGAVPGGLPRNVDVNNATTGRKSCVVSDSNKSTENSSCLTPNKDGDEVTLSSLSSRASKQRVRRKRVITYKATTLTRASMDEAELEGDNLKVNRGEESRVKWEKILHDNTFSVREVGSNSEVPRPLSTSSPEVVPSGPDILFKEAHLKCIVAADENKGMPLGSFNTQPSKSVTRIFKRGKHWFKKVVPAVPSKCSEISECAREDKPTKSRLDSVLKSCCTAKMIPGNILLNRSTKLVRQQGEGGHLTTQMLPSRYPPQLAFGDIAVHPELTITATQDPALSTCTFHPSQSDFDKDVTVSAHDSSMCELPQDRPEVQFVAMEDVKEEGCDNASLTDYIDPLGGDSEDPLSFDQTTGDPFQDSEYDISVGREDSLLERANISKTDSYVNDSDSGLGNSLDNYSKLDNPSTHQMKTDSVGKRPVHYNRRASSYNNHKNNKNISASLNETPHNCPSTCPTDPSATLSNQQPEPPLPSVLRLRDYSLTDDAVHFYQSKQIIIDPKNVHHMQKGDTNKPSGVCIAEDFIVKNFSSNNYVFCEVNPNVSQLPRGLHRFSLLVKGNRLYRSSKPCQTFRIQAAPSHDDPTGSTATGCAAPSQNDPTGSTATGSAAPSHDDPTGSTATGSVAPGNSGTYDSDSAQPSVLTQSPDIQGSSSYPRLSSSGGLIMRNPHDDLKRFLLSNDRLQKLYAGLQEIQRSEKAARRAAKCRLNGPPSSRYGIVLRELYSERVHIQVHFHKVLNYLKVLWFKEKIQEAKSRAAVTNSSGATDTP